MKIFAALIVSAVMPPVASAAALFDKPLAVTRIPLPKDKLNPQAKPELSCFQYRQFVVKQIDQGEKGAAQLSIIPLTTGENFACDEKNSANEKVVDGGDWTGYFKGVKDNFVFFDADDGWNGGVGFAVFSADGKKIFSDTAKSGLHAIVPGATGITLLYTRVYGATCSLYADAKGCWKIVQRDTGIAQAQAPVCAASYKLAIKQTKSEAAKQMAEVPSAVEYEVEAMLDAGSQRITPKRGKIGCRIQD